MYVCRLARVDNGLSTTTANTDNFFFPDESFGRDKYLLERRQQSSQQSSESGSNTARSSIVSEENYIERSRPIITGEKSRIYAGGGGGGQVKEPLLSAPH